MEKHTELQSKWSKAFWVRGYYVATVGDITEDVIKKYIQEQSEESHKEESDGIGKIQLQVVSRIIIGLNYGKLR